MVHRLARDFSHVLLMTTNQYKPESQVGFAANPLWPLSSEIQPKFVS